MALVGVHTAAKYHASELCNVSEANPLLPEEWSQPQSHVRQQAADEAAAPSCKVYLQLPYEE